jgi:hypothetical protein
MHYVFKSKADADLIMMMPVAEQLLQIIGRAPSSQGIIEAAQIPAAIKALEQAIAAEKRTGDPDGESDDHHDERIGLHRRAWPLLEMMRRSAAEGADIVWGV